MTDVRLDVHGVPEVRAALAAVKARAQDLTGPSETIGQALAAAIAAATPRRSGLLASSWSVIAGPTGVKVENAQLYAAPVEYGVPARAQIGAYMATRTLEAQTPAIAAGYEAALADAGRDAGFEVKT